MKKKRGKTPTKWDHRIITPQGVVEIRVIPGKTLPVIQADMGHDQQKESEEKRT